MHNLRQRYKYVKEKIKKEILEKDEEGKEIVNITITDSDSLLSVYHTGNVVIDNSMAEVINEAIKSTSYNRDINLHITCEKYTPDKESTYKNAIKNYTPQFKSVEEYVKHKKVVNMDKTTVIYGEDGTITLDF